MQKNSATLVVVSTGLAALSYFGVTANRTADGPQFAQPVASSTVRKSANVAAEPRKNAGGNSQNYEVVNVFYGTDRAMEGRNRATISGRSFAVYGGASLGFCAITAWLALLGRRKAAWAVGLSGLAVVGVLLATMPPLTPATAGGRPLMEGSREYGTGRGSFQMGTCSVTIPRVHQMGKVEHPTWLRLEFQERLDRHVTLQRVLPQKESDFYAGLRARVQASPRRDLFVFVHGYNVTFEMAALRTAQMAHDLNFQGAPVFYSWPSQGQTWKYAVDENNVAWTVPHLKQFLLDVGRYSQARAINLIAHSMGNRALAQAVRELALELRTDQRLFSQIILAAPDIDADVFRRDIAPAMAGAARQVTLYASAHDEALVASKLVHGFRRLGDVDDHPVVVPGIDTIDVSAIDLSILGHSYYGSSEPILRDMAALVHESRPTSQRPWLRPVRRGRDQYWRYDETFVTTAEQPQGRPQRR